MDGQAIAGLEADRFDRGHLAGIEPLAILHQEPGLAGVSVIQVELARVGVAAHRDDDLLAILGGAGEVDELARERRRQGGVQLRVRMVLVDQLDLRRAGLGDRRDHGVAVGGLDQRGDFRHRILVQHREAAIVGVEGAERRGLLAVALGRVDGAVRRGAEDFDALATGLGTVDQRPLAAGVAPIQFVVRVGEIAFLVIAVVADREARLLLLVQRDTAVVARRARQRLATSAQRVHQHDFGSGAGGGPCIHRGHHDVVRIILQRVQQVEALVADLLATLCGIAGAVENQRPRLRTVGIDGIPFTGAERPRIAADLLDRVEQQAIRRGPVETADALFFRQLVDLDDAQVLGPQHGQDILVAAVDGHRQVFAIGRNLHAAVGRMLDEILHRDQLDGLRGARHPHRGRDASPLPFPHFHCSPMVEIRQKPDYRESNGKSGEM